MIGKRDPRKWCGIYEPGDTTGPVVCTAGDTDRTAVPAAPATARAAGVEHAAVAAGDARPRGQHTVAEAAAQPAYGAATADAGVPGVRIGAAFPLRALHAQRQAGGAARRLG